MGIHSNWHQLVKILSIEQHLHLLILRFLLVGLNSSRNKLSKKSKITKTEFGVKRYDVFREVTCAVSESCGSAAHKGGSATPVQVLMASF